MCDKNCNKTVNVLDYDVSIMGVNEIVSSAIEKEGVTVVNTINPHSYIEAKNDDEFNVALTSSDVLIPDGSGIVFAAKVLANTKLQKIAGADLFKSTLEFLGRNKGRVFFLGSSQSVLDKISKKLMIDFPTIEAEFLSPPFKSSFSIGDVNEFAEKINEFRPNVVFVGLTAPKQEKLINQMRDRVNVSMISGIGAVFDFYAENVRRPSPFWIKLHLEWLIRFMGEPKRLWKRNFISAPLFLIEIFLKKISS